MSGWAREHAACAGCGGTRFPHQGRGLCSSCYGRRYRPGLLAGTQRAGQVWWEAQEAAAYEREEAEQEQAWTAWEEEVTAAWVVWHEGPSPDPRGWGR